MKFGTPFEGPKRKNEFVNQPHPTKMVKIEVLVVFLENCKFSILISDNSHKSLLFISITFFD